MPRSTRTALTVVTLVAVVTVPLVGTLWSARHAAATVVAATHRELLFTELLLGVLTTVLTVVLGWLTLSSVAGSVGALTHLSRDSRSGRARHRSGWTGHAAGSPGGSAVAAAVTALVLLAAGTQAASATVSERSAVGATAPAVTPGPGTPGQNVSAVVTAHPDTAHPAESSSVVTGGPSQSTELEPAVVGGWTPRVSPVAPATAQLVLGASTAATDEEASVGAGHVVLRGESLWSITAAHLGPGASATEISAAWPRWWQANRDVIGDDPDLIHAGQQLRPPA